MPSRRVVMIGLGGLLATAALPRGARLASAQTLAMAELRGGFDASEAGILPGTADDQSRKLQDLIDRAAAVGQPRRGSRPAHGPPAAPPTRGVRAKPWNR